MTDKGPSAFRTISEASQAVGVAAHVLRFWETRFAFIRPMKRAGGRRFYRPQDLEVLRGVRALLHDDGYTIKGVQKLHREGGLSRLLDVSGVAGDAAAAGAGSGAAIRPAPAPDAGLAVLPTTAPPPEPDADDARQTDLFTAPSEAAPEPRDAPDVAAPEPGRDRHVLDRDARERLAAVLADLEAVQARIDGLLARSAAV